MKKKIKLTKAGKIYICFSILLCLFILFNSFFTNNDDNSENLNNFDKYPITNIFSELIVSSKESDFDIVNTYFANGMSIESFGEICNRVYDKVDSINKYSNVNYNFEEKLHYSDIENILNKLNNSSIVDLYVIGSSHDDRNLYGIEIGNGDKVIYIDANIHAAEVASTPFLVRFLSDLVNKYENGDINIKNALNTFKIVAIPSLNPDGYEVYNFGIESIRNHDLWIYQNKDKVDYDNFKYNANGVDLNRNFPTQNAGLYYKSKNLISSVAMEKSFKRNYYFGGKELGSEPETMAAMSYILKHYKNTIMYVNLHSQGRVIYAGKPNLSSDFNNSTLEFANKVSNITGYTVHGLAYEEVGEGNDGSVTDFFAEIVNGFKFSNQTLRLSNDKYVDGNVQLKYDVPVITIETLTTYTSDPAVFKKEYYDYGLEKLFYSFIEE